MIQPQYAQPYSQGTPSANAVNIQIFEPKAYASPAPVQPNNYTTQLYGYPQGTVYGMPQMPQYNAPYTAPYMMPQYQVPPQMVQYPGYAEQPQVYTVPPQVVSPAPQPMPAPAIEQEAPVQPVAEVQPAPQQVAVEQPAQPAQTIDIASLLSGLQSTDSATVEKAITEIANYSQGEPAVAQQVLNEQIMNALANIVSTDNSQLQGPTEAQQAAFNKKANGEKLTPDEEQLAKLESPKTLADKNKIIAMFTLAMLQKNQRDELDAYIASQGAGANIPPIGTDNLIGFNEIQNAIQNDTNPEVRLAGIQAVSYIAKPEDAAAVQATLQKSLTDSEPLIQQAAQEVLGKFAPAQSLGTTQA